MEKKLLEIVNFILIKNNHPILKTLDKSLNLRDDLGFDSLDLAELTVKIEDSLKVDIFENGFVYTIGDVIKLLV
jgi:acyl carrier protein